MGVIIDKEESYSLGSAEVYMSLEQDVVSYTNYPQNMQIYSKPSSIDKISLPRCILH